MSDAFIVGPVRSGTSWLHTMLSEHPDFASPPETHLFANYLGPLEDAWRADQARLRRALETPGARVGFGLAPVVTDDEFTEMLRTWFATVRSLVLSAKPGATRLLEKTPDHSLWIDTIWRVAPDALIVFMVRDPRSTVRSVLSARTEAWGVWAPESLADATSLWLRNVRQYFSRKRDKRVMLLRYEDLRSDAAELDRVAKFLGLEPPAKWRATAHDVAPTERTSLVTRGEAASNRLRPYDAEGFSYHDRRTYRTLTPYETAYIVSRCHDEMNALGYPTDIGKLPARLRIEQAARAMRFKLRRGRR
jgi:Sulfotransferase family